MTNMSEAKYVLYDIEKYKRDHGTRWMLETYKKTSAVGGPLDLSQFDPGTAHVLWECQQPVWLRFGLVIFRAVHRGGDNVPPGFVLGIVAKEDLDLEGWKIIDLWIQEDHLYIDIELDVDAIAAVNGDVEDYLEPAGYSRLRDARLSRGLHKNPNSFVMVLTFLDGIPPMPRNWMLPSETQLPAPRTRSPQQRTSLSSTNQNFEDRSITPAYSSDEYEADNSASPSSVASDPEQVMEDYSDTFPFAEDNLTVMADNEERLAARMDAEYRLTRGTMNPDQATFQDGENNASAGDNPDDSAGYSSGAALRDLLGLDGQRTFTMPNNEGPIRNAAASADSAGSDPPSRYRHNSAGNNIFSEPVHHSTNEMEPQLPTHLAETETTEAAPLYIDSDGSSPPRRRAKDLGEYLGVFQKPLKKSQHTPSQSSSSEESIKGSGSKSKFLPGMFKGKEKPNSASTLSSEGGATSPRRLVKTRPAPTGNKSGAAQGGSFSRATGPGLARSENILAGSIGRATRTIANEDVDHGPNTPALASPAASGTRRRRRGGNRDSAETVNQEQYRNSSNLVNREFQNNNSAPVASATRNAFSTSSTPSNPLPTNTQNGAGVAAVQTPTIVSRVFPADSWQARVRGNYNTKVDQAEDDYEAIAEIDEFEEARRVDEERERTRWYWQTRG
ncbi:uncharacterized protein LAJ45_08841 [Morchella importuna]|uniref:uncharacterized protein n=1 Tax=Morchella importuna TaxID=1174673 RepID=UPI001E8CBA33|nr:uncharacterized protein LAJ45_08841 [Morchella importuna]KAH8147042.1 hypothetical protein LAJ45_08841 [Morchella importuna]